VGNRDKPRGRGKLTLTLFSIRSSFLGGLARVAQVMPMLRGEAAVGEGSDGVPATGAEISEREGCERRILTQIQPSDSPLLHEWLAIAARAKEKDHQTADAGSAGAKGCGVTLQRKIDSDPIFIVPCGCRWWPRCRCASASSAGSLSSCDVGHRASTCWRRKCRSERSQVNQDRGN
jgi:hypothetical protein